MDIEQLPQDFHQLPPAVKRKLFSNLERLRLEQMRLAQTDAHDDNRHYRSAVASTASTRFTSSKARSRKRRHYHVKRPSTSSLSAKPRSIIPRLLQRPNNPLQPTYLITREDAEWFRSLPSKVQQQHFSIDEQVRLGGWRGSIIFDSADQALYKLGRQAGESSISVCSDSVLSQSSSFTMSSGRFVDSAIDVDESFYDSFRWLDDDEGIDLRLDDYHAHLAKTRYDVSKPSSKNGHARRPSFRRTFSLTSTQRDQSGTRFNSSHRQALPFSNPTSVGFHHRSLSKPTAPRVYNPRHTPLSSVSSIDHPAQHYKDPEARLKLRVYLASPQKFDEAVEFGFPSLDDKDDSCPRLSVDRDWKMHEATNSFHNNGSHWSHEKASYEIHAEKGSESDTSSRGSSEGTLTNDEPKKVSKPSTPSQQPRRPRILHQPYTTPNLGGREMTLKMTLTRPDLRTATDGPSEASPKTSDLGDPLRLAELPASGQNPILWDIPEDRSVVKKVWRKIRGRC